LIPEIILSTTRTIALIVETMVSIAVNMVSGTSTAGKAFRTAKNNGLSLFDHSRKANTKVGTTNTIVKKAKTMGGGIKILAKR
jgi:hypothetical protein